MVKFGNILKRSWQILWNYKILWIFGFLVALATGGSGGGNSGGGSGSNNQSDGRYSGGFEGFKDFRGRLPENAPQWAKDWAEWFTNTVVPMFTHPDQYIGTFVMIGLVILLIMVVIGLLTSLYRYPAETAIIRMVDDYETTGTKVGFKAGWKLGWNRRAFRLWLIDLVLGLPCMLLFIGLGGTAAYMIISSTAGGREAINPGGILGGILIAVLGLLVIFMAAVILSLLRNFFARVAVLEDAGVGDSFRQGWAMFKRNWKSAGLMWLIMIGICILFAIASAIAFFLLIPVVILLILPAGCSSRHTCRTCLPDFPACFTAGPLDLDHCCACRVAVLRADPQIAFQSD